MQVLWGGVAALVDRMDLTECVMSKLRVSSQVYLKSQVFLCKTLVSTCWQARSTHSIASEAVSSRPCSARGRSRQSRSDSNSLQNLQLATPLRFPAVAGHHPETIDHLPGRPERRWCATKTSSGQVALPLAGIACLELRHEDEDVDFVVQARHGGHSQQELLRRTQILGPARELLARLQLIVLWRDLRAGKATGNLTMNAHIRLYYRPLAGQQRDICAELLHRHGTARAPKSATSGELINKGTGEQTGV